MPVFFSSLFNKPYVGLDINSNRLSLVQVIKGKNKLIGKINCSALPEGVVIDGQVRQPVVLKDKLYRLINATGSCHCSAAIAVPAKNVISKHLQLSGLLNETECEIEINNRLKHHAEELSFDFFILEKQLFQQDIFFAAINSEQLKNFVEVVNGSGLIVKVVDVDVFAFVRAVNFLHTASALNLLFTLAKKDLLISFGLALRGLS